MKSENSFRKYYDSPLGRILLTSDEESLTGLWFEGSKYYPEDDGIEEETEPIILGKRWLDEYFSGGKPDFTPPLKLSGSDFRRRVWRILLDIPYGETRTYGEIAALLKGDGKMSSQAVGGAVAHNPAAIIVPCHRVIGVGGSLTGYAGGIWRKKRLLEIEGVI